MAIVLANCAFKTKKKYSYAENSVDKPNKHNFRCLKPCVNGKISYSLCAVKIQKKNNSVCS